MRVFLVLVLASLALSKAAPPFPGYILSTQFRCDDALCPDWELDITRVDTSFRTKNLTLPLVTLVPKSPIAQMSFPVFSAFHEPSRIYYVVASPTSADSGTVWGARVSNDVSSAELLFSNNFQFPSSSGVLVGLQVTTNGSLLVILEQGDVLQLDAKTGKASLLANLLLASNFTDGHVYAATAYDAARESLFAVVTDQYKNSLSVAVLDVHLGVVSTNAITTKQREKFGAEIVMEAVWINTSKTMAVFFQSVTENIGFDQILSLDPYTGKGSFMFYDLMQNLIGFECDPSTKDCDRLSTACYDALDQKLYFQGTQYSGSDDIGTTTLQMVLLNGRFPVINAALDPFTFGFENFQFVQVVV